eukprot:362534-Chlamydomonas_euryale.AAC.2
MLGWRSRRKMHTSRSTRFAFSVEYSTSPTRFSATCGRTCRAACGVLCRRTKGKGQRAKGSGEQHPQMLPTERAHREHATLCQSTHPVAMHPQCLWAVCAGRRLPSCFLTTATPDDTHPRACEGARLPLRCPPGLRPGLSNQGCRSAPALVSGGLRQVACVRWPASASGTDSDRAALTSSPCSVSSASTTHEKPPWPRTLRSL